MSNGNLGFLKYVLIALVVGFILLTPRQSDKRKPASKSSNDAWFQEAVLQEPRPVLVKFGADWCAPCRSLDATLESIEPKLAGNMKVVRIDVDEHPGLASTYGVRGIPQSFIFYRGQIIDRQTGFMDEDTLSRWIGSAAAKAESSLAGR
jgi:thioredoxin